MPAAASLEITLTPTGRHLTFRKELPEAAHVFRRAGGPWTRLAVHARSPYLDADVFAPGTQLDYYVLHATRHGDEEMRSPVVSVTVPQPG